MNKFKRIIVTPAGRKRYMRLLIGYLELQRKEFDKYVIWMNCVNPEDVAFLESMPSKYDWIELDDRRTNPNELPGIHVHFSKCVDPDTIYLRLDDDIVFLEPGFLRDTFRFREENPQYFLTFSNIVNNAIIDFIHQRLGACRISRPLEYDCCGDIAWKNPEIAIEKHASFFDRLKSNQLSAYRFPRWELPTCERVSINAISWFGSEFAKFGGQVDSNEEVWLSCDKPFQLKKMNCIGGGSLCCHFSFFPTREVLDKTEILDAYEQVLRHYGGRPAD